MIKITGMAKKLVLMVLVAACLMTTGCGGSSVAPGLLYVKDYEDLAYSDYSKQNQDVTSDICEDGNGDYYGYLSDMISISKDGKLLFFPKDINYSGVTLCFTKLGKKNAEAEKIDSGVTAYSVSDDAKIVTYIKDGSVLYQSDLKEKEKIKSDIKDYWVSYDGKTLLYLDYEGSLYLKSYGKDAEKLDSNVTSVERVLWEDLKVFYEKDGTSLYLKEGKKEKVKIDTNVDEVYDWGIETSKMYYTDTEENLYVKDGDKDSEKIDTEVYRVLNVYESGEIFYIKREYVDLAEYIDDDMTASDASMDIWDAAYYTKMVRDGIREEVKNYSYSVYEIYYYNGEESVCLSENCLDRSSIAISHERPVITFSEGNIDQKKVKMSTVDTDSYASAIVEEIYYNLREKMRGDMVQYVATADNVEATEFETVESVTFNSEGTEMLVVTYEDSDYNLYTLSLGKNKIGKVKEYATDIHYEGVSYVLEDWIVYFKDVKDESGDLYVNGERIAYDADVYGITVLDELGEILYAVDSNENTGKWTVQSYNGKKAEKVADDVSLLEYNVTEDGTIVSMFVDEKDYAATLKVYNGKKVVTVSEDVYDIAFGLAGELVYLCDYSTSSGKADLYYYNGKEGVKIDEDVTDIITPNYSRYLEMR